MLNRATIAQRATRAVEITVSTERSTSAVQRR